MFQPKHAVLHRTETLCLRDLSLEKGALKVVCCNKRTKTWMRKKRMESFFDSEKDILQDIIQIKKDKKKIRVSDLYVWCMMFWGHLPNSRYTGTL